ncbi:translation initiation factor IF-2 isoform X2 [Entelurus aequoreus]|uniref:translation initiation factor IF-2 isoform X2 n=1 Tax=Entelurus aequoreus TaxID=161455 RepID=UPI002B1DA450|nr:translation initiation factor IF-2 isoform X2 [Entelurus aequoreus]
MLCPAFLQASLLLCLIEQTLQGGVKPQSVSWGRVVPARGVGIGAKTKGVHGALGALGSRYANKPLKAGIGHYPVTSPLGVGGYRPLGLGNVPARLPSGYGNHGVYGAGLGTGLPLGHGHTNGHGLGHGGKRVYGGVPLTGYGPLPGMGYPAVRPGVSAADVGGLEKVTQGQAAQDGKRAKSGALGAPLGGPEGTLGVERSNKERGSALGPTAPELDTDSGFAPAVLVTGIEAKSLDPKLEPNLGAQSLGLAVSPAPAEVALDPLILKRKISASHGATRPSGGSPKPESVDQDKLRTIDASSPAQNGRGNQASRLQRWKIINCGSSRNLGHHLARAAPQAPRPETFGLLPAPDANPLTRLRAPRIILAPEQKRRGVLGIPAQNSNERTISGTSSKQPPNPQTQEVQRSSIPLTPQAGLGVGGGQEGYGQGNYLGAGLVPGAYGPALGQGAYLGAGGKLGAALGHGGYTKGPAGVSTGYGNGAAGYGNGAAGYGNGAAGYGNGGAGFLGAQAGNGYGHGNGYGTPYGAALNTGGYAGQPQVPYGGLGAGLDPSAGKYAGAQGPYAGAPVASSRLEDGGYPYAAQPIGLSGDGSKSASKHGAAYGTPQAGYGQQLGASQDALGQQAGKYGAGTGPLAGGYKG